MASEDSLHCVGIIDTSIQRAAMLVVVYADYKSYAHNFTLRTSKSINKVFDGIPCPYDGIYAINLCLMIGIGPNT